MGGYDSSPGNLESRGKSCAGNITSLAKVPGKCQNKMCWLRSGTEKSIPGCPRSKSLHFLTSISGRGISHFSVLFSTTDSTLDSPFWSSPRSGCTRHSACHHGQQRHSLAPLIPRNLPSGSRRRLTCKENSTHSSGVHHEAGGPSQTM